MGKQRAQNNPFQPSDYDEPTEPLAPLTLPVYGDPSYVGNMPPTVPVAPLHLPPVAPAEQSVYPYHQPSQAAYPVLPPVPLKKQRGQPPGGSSVGNEPWPVRKRRRSALPGAVRLGFLMVQLILLARVVCLLFGVQNTTLWLTLLYAAGDLFVLPVHWLAANINLSVLAGAPFLIYLEFLVAILAYGLFSRLLTLLLRALLN